MANLKSNALSILVTRPDPQGFELCHLLESKGFKAPYLPTISFLPVYQSNTETILAALGKQDWLIFTSPRAVWTSVALIRQHWPELPATVHFAAVGKGTAEALKEAGYLSIYPVEGEGADYLLSLPNFASVAGLSITIIKGAKGRETLQEVLANRQARVSTWVTYQRTIPAMLDVQPFLVLLQANQIDAIVCTSYDGVRHLEILIGADNTPILHTLPLIVVSERIKMLAQHLGYRTIWVATSANHQAILDVLEQKREVLCKIQQTKHVQQNNQ